MPDMTTDPKKASAFRFVRCSYADGGAELVCAFDDGEELIERVTLPDAPAVPPARVQPLKAALRLLHLIAGVSYYKAGVPGRIAIDGDPIDAPTAALLEQLYEHGLAEFAYQNRLDLRGRIRFPHAASSSGAAMRANLERRSLVPIGGGKDSIVTVELLRAMAEPMTVAWVGSSELIAHCAARTALPRLNVGRALAPQLFEMNRQGAWNGHIPVTAINSAILVLAAIVYGHDTIVFSNERSASAPTLESDGREVNHQWSKGYAFEQAFGAYITTHVASDLCYFSLLRPLSELAVTRLFGRLVRYHDVFSSCNRNFKILGERPGSRWCGACPKCHFVFLALAPFLPKPQLVAIFGRNLLDDATLAPAFDALMEWNAHKPFECVGEARESRAAMAALARRAEWREDAIVARFRDEIAPHIDVAQLALEPLLAPAGEHRIPDRYARFDALARA